MVSGNIMGNLLGLHMAASAVQTAVSNLVVLTQSMAEWQAVGGTGGVKEAFIEQSPELKMKINAIQDSLDRFKKIVVQTEASARSKEE